MPQPTTSSAQATREAGRAHTPPAAWIGAAWIWGVFGLCAILPGAIAALSALRGIIGDRAAAPPVQWLPGPALLESALYAGGIALLATLLALPVAVATAHLGTRWRILVAAPMLLPTYLAYAAWSILRAPTTPLGKLIGGAPERGLEWIPILAGRTLAIWALAIWAWPLAAVVISIGLRALGPDVVEALRLERCSPWRRWRCLAGAARPSILAAILLIGLLMLGSAVPLHLAQIRTHAIRVWMILDEHPAEPWRAWIAAWPLLLVALGAGALLAPKLARAGRTLAATADPDRAAPGPSGPTTALASVPWILSMLVPLALFAWSTGSLRPLTRFVRDAGPAVASSAGIALAVGILAVTLALGASQTVAACRGRAGPALPLLALALAWALIPGVLAGAAVAHMMRLPFIPLALADSPLPVVLAHLSRFAFLPLLVGIWLGTAEAERITDLRVLDDALRPRAWARTALASHLGPALAAGFAAACLSFQEIESTIQVQPPGIDHLAQRLLQWLHYERMTELSAAGTILLGSAVALSLLILLSLPRRRNHRGVHR